MKRNDETVTGPQSHASRTIISRKIAPIGTLRLFPLDSHDIQLGRRSKIGHNS